MNEEILNTETGLSILSSFPLLKDLSADELVIIKDALIPLSINKNETIFNEGDAGNDMFIQFRGTLSAYAKHEDGSPHHLFNVHKTEFFGEMSIITKEPRSVTIVASEDSITLKLRGNDFYRIIEEHPAIGFKLLRKIGSIQTEWLDYRSKTFNDLTRWGETASRRAITDEMTGLHNRRYLHEKAKELFDNTSENLRKMTMLMMDLDKIHGVNDRYGTKAGDIVITAVAQIVQSYMRPGDIASRLSGDEFAVLLPVTELDYAKEIAELIRKTIENKQIEVPEAPGSAETVFINTRTSIGIAIAPKDANTLEELEEASDAALRKAKENGRNRIEVYS